ncbi:hypothetical protein CHELA40_11213 [Chelatococcus asaccharovorans]|nr:hypothetical protein CHELA40_11213 [Chelatococcus asaccharovorans]CAH1685213.1 hypothetical protein CHELA17_64387 [Chelatococcus asaccharovorans]
MADHADGRLRIREADHLRGSRLVHRRCPDDDGHERPLRGRQHRALLLSGSADRCHRRRRSGVGGAHSAQDRDGTAHDGQADIGRARSGSGADQPGRRKGQAYRHRPGNGSGAFPDGADGSAHHQALRVTHASEKPFGADVGCADRNRSHLAKRGQEGGGKCLPRKTRAGLCWSVVVRLRHLHPPDTGLGANVGVKRTTSKLLVLVELLNLTFDLELDVRRDSNVKFAPLAFRDRGEKLNLPSMPTKILETIRPRQLGR